MSEDINYVLTKVSAFCSIAVIQAKAGDIKGANELFVTAKKIGLDITGVFQSTAYAHIAQAQAHAGDLAGAKKTAKNSRLFDAYAKRFTYATIAEIQAKTGQLEDLQNWLASLDDPLVATYGYLGAARGLTPESKP